MNIMTQILTHNGPISDTCRDSCKQSDGKIMTEEIAIFFFFFFLLKTLCHKHTKPESTGQRQMKIAYC